MAKGVRKKKEVTETTEVIGEMLENSPGVESSIITEEITEMEKDKEITLSSQLINQKSENIIEEKEKIPEVMMEFENVQMSDQAIKWEKYIAMYKLTPEKFLEKYPTHTHRKFIEEIIEFRKKKN